MESSSRRVVSIFMGIYGAILGFIHGVFELHQGNIHNLIGLIYAKGIPCDPNTSVDGCWPALSLIPNMRATGILAITFSVILLIWVIFLLPMKYGGWIQLGITFLMLIFGTGFIPVFYGIASSILGLYKNSTLNWWQKKGLGRKILAIIWLFPFMFQSAWNFLVLTTNITIMNTILEKAGTILLPIELVILILTIFTTLAYDGQVKLRKEMDQLENPDFIYSAAKREEIIKYFQTVGTQHSSKRFEVDGVFIKIHPSKPNPNVPMIIHTPIEFRGDIRSIIKAKAAFRKKFLTAGG